MRFTTNPVCPHCRSPYGVAWAEVARDPLRLGAEVNCGDCGGEIYVSVFHPSPRFAVHPEAPLPPPRIVVVEDAPTP